jgi:hypothetical protein
MSALATTDQIRAMQAARRKAGISDEDWSARLEREAGVTSTRLVPRLIAARILDDLSGASKPLQTPVAKGAMNLTGPYAGKLRALWLTGYNLGVVRDRTDRALVTFVERQTGLEHTRFLRSAADARKAVEGLKQWISREAEFEWPSTDDVDAIQSAIIERQHAILKGTSLETHFMTSVLHNDQMIVLGQRVRRLRGSK